MNATRSLSLIRSLVITLLAVVIYAATASAQMSPAVSKGKFTLPVETRWANATLPAGNYTFILDSAGLSGSLSLRRDGRYVARMWARGITEVQSTRPSELIIVRHGNRGTVRTLYLADLGLVLNYQPPGAGGQLMAQGPELIQRVPVTRAGK